MKKNEFQHWLKTTTSKQPSMGHLIAFNIGIFENEKGYSVYIVGSKRFDDDDPDWACDGDYSSADNYLTLPDWCVKKQSWEQVLRNVVSEVERFLGSEAIEESFLKHAQAVTVGFDDGDLIRVR
jgi:hypothetical protein